MYKVGDGVVFDGVKVLEVPDIVATVELKMVDIVEAVGVDVEDELAEVDVACVEVAVLIVDEDNPVALVVVVVGEVMAVEEIEEVVAVLETDAEVAETVVIVDEESAVENPEQFPPGTFSVSPTNNASQLSPGLADLSESRLTVRFCAILEPSSPAATV